MKYISLPNGMIVNLEQVAFISTEGDELHVSYSATYTTARACVPMTLRLKGEDAKALLDGLKTAGVETQHTIAALNKKRG